MCFNSSSILTSKRLHTLNHIKCLYNKYVIRANLPDRLQKPVPSRSRMNWILGRWTLSFALCPAKGKHDPPVHSNACIWYTNIKRWSIKTRVEEEEWSCAVILRCFECFTLFLVYFSSCVHCEDMTSGNTNVFIGKYILKYTKTDSTSEEI